jgi:hypothetical protein
MTVIFLGLSSLVTVLRKLIADHSTWNNLQHQVLKEQISADSILNAVRSTLEGRYVNDDPVSVLDRKTVSRLPKIALSLDLLPKDRPPFMDSWDKYDVLKKDLRVHERFVVKLSYED